MGRDGGVIANIKGGGVEILCDEKGGHFSAAHGDRRYRLFLEPRCESDSKSVLALSKRNPRHMNPVTDPKTTDIFPKLVVFDLDYTLSPRLSRACPKN